MQTQGVFTIVLNENHQLLLTKRRDYPIWDLPGGVVEENETLIECAIREAEEETGYQIEIDEKIGEYHRPDANDIQHIYLGCITGGAPIINNDETSELKFFSLKKLPFLMVPHRKRQIHDFMKGQRNNHIRLSDSTQMLLVLKRVLNLK